MFEIQLWNLLSLFIGELILRNWLPCFMGMTPNKMFAD